MAYFNKISQKLFKKNMSMPQENNDNIYPEQLLNLMTDDRRELAVLPPSFDDFENDKVISVVAAAKRQHKIKPFTLIDSKNTATPIIQNFAKGRIETRDPLYVSFVKNLRVSGTGLLVTKDGELMPESSIRSHHAFLTEDRNQATIKITESIDQVNSKVASPTIVLTGVFPLHFTHWLYDNYAKLSLARRVLGDLKGYKVAVGFGNRRGGWCKPTSYQYECLSFLGIAHEDVIMLHERKWVEFENAIVLPEVNNFKPPTQKIYNDPEIFEFFDDVYELSGLERTPKTTRIHLSRTDNENRKCLNEQAVIDKLARLGFEDKIIGGMTMREQMQFFSNIDIACGPAGANLTTMCFMQPGSKFITYFPPQASHFLAYYQSYCSDVGIDMYAICASKYYWDGPKTSLDNLRWEIDRDEVVSLIERLC